MGTVQKLRCVRLVVDDFIDRSEIFSIGSSFKQKIIASSSDPDPGKFYGSGSREIQARDLREWGKSGIVAVAAES